MPPKKCYYDVMALTITATDEEIRRSYRQLALALHPDKNLENTEYANKQFTLLQEAYDVLSDPKERAWYDRHRDAILRGHDRERIVDEETDIFEYFTSYCYDSFTDDEHGFYTVYRNLFEKLVSEDKPYRDNDHNDDIAPNFGKSDTDYDEVHRFYSYWQSYCTPKTYTWLDKYNINDAPNRRVVRLIEKENKKIRDSAKKKRNEEIRELVAFVRKRDKRVIENRRKLEAKAMENKKKSEAIRIKQMQERNKELENYCESEWTSMAALEQELRELENNLDSNESRKVNESNSDSEQSDESNLYCLACDKAFKSDKAFANHENSKKHKNNVTILKRTLENDLNDINT